MRVKTCIGPCGRELALEAFPMRGDRPGKRRSECLDCRAQRERERYANSPSRRQAQNDAQTRRRAAVPEVERERERRRQREQHAAVKAEVFAAYGDCCACCGEDTVEFLTLDHVNGLGDHKRADGQRLSSSQAYRAVRREGFPDRYQLLCFNCNCAKGIYGTCPHQVREEAIS